MKKNKINSAYMIPLIRSTLLNDLYHIKPLLYNDQLDKSIVESLIELKNSILDLLPPENGSLKEVVSIPPKSMANIFYYDAVNKEGTSQFEFLQQIVKCENARKQLIKETLEKGLLSDHVDQFNLIYKEQREFLSKLNNQVVRP